jgi:outer membrane receptor protein involved in Fe transport
MNIRRRSIAALLLGTASFVIAAPTFAQTASEDQAQAVNEPDDSGSTIIVTATKRASTVQDVPFSINAQSQEDIQRANATTIEEISRNVAGLAIQNVGPGQSSVAIRGVSAGQIARDQAGVKEQVGVYLDESVISLSLFTPDIDLFDLNRVETLRGPQGTLFGSGSVGGTLRYITNQPKIGKTEGLVEANIHAVDESDLGGHIKGAINLPLGNTAAIRVVGYYQKYAGFIDAKGPAGEKNINDGSRVGGRISMLWEPTSELKITPRVVYQEVEADGFNREEVFNLFANPLSTTRPPFTFDEREQYLLLKEKFKDDTLIADLTASYDFGGVELTSVTSRIDRDILVSRDASALTGSISDDVGLPDAAVLLPSNLLDTTKLKTWTQELRLGSTGSGPLQWVFGGFYSKVDRRYLQQLPTPGYAAFVDAAFGAGTSAAVSNGFENLDSPYNSQVPFDIRQSALFGEASYDFGQFKLTGGGRYYKFKEERDFTSGGLFGNGDNIVGEGTKSSGFSPRAIVTWEPSNNLSLNAQVAKGFRLGGVNDPLNIPICSTADALLFGPFAGEFEDETLWNYEAGVKYSRRGITFNAAAFYTDIKNLQINVAAGSCSSRVSVTSEKAHTKGLEAEFSASPMRGLDLSVAGSVLEAEFDSTLVEPLATLIGIRKGNRLPGVPKFQIAATATYGQRFSDNGDWRVTASFQHVGNRFTRAADQENNPRTFIYRDSPFHPTADFGGIPIDAGTTLNLRLPSYNLVNLSAGIDFDSGLALVLYANNVFDESPKLSFDEERGGRARLGFHVGQPRTIGLTIRQAFGSTPLPPAPPPPPPPPPPPATQTCPDGAVILATDICPAPPAYVPPPPPEAAPERG